MEKDAPPKFTELNELASKRNGGKVLFATDDWFAEAEKVISDEEPVFKTDLYTDCGKWMDGWESRRKRCPGHDWCIIKLGVAGVIHGLDVDTAFFTGNYAPRYSIQAARLTAEEEARIPPRPVDPLGTACTKETMEQMKDLRSEKWTELVPMTELRPGYEETRHNYKQVESDQTWTHLRLNIYPDGGVARLRVFGEARNLTPVNLNESIDLLAMTNGGVCRGYSNAHYGHPRNLIRPGNGINMGDGWETARRLDRPPILEADENGILLVPGSEWAVFKLGYIGTASRLMVDTRHFKGNYPDSVKIEGGIMKPSREWNNRTMVQAAWKTILPATKLSPNKVHFFEEEDLVERGPFSHVRITMAPDGGISRVRLFGTTAAPQI